MCWNSIMTDLRRPWFPNWGLASSKQEHSRDFKKSLRLFQLWFAKVWFLNQIHNYTNTFNKGVCKCLQEKTISDFYFSQCGSSPPGYKWGAIQIKRYRPSAITVTTWVFVCVRPGHGCWSKSLLDWLDRWAHWGKSGKWCCQRLSGEQSCFHINIWQKLSISSSWRSFLKKRHLTEPVQ